MNEIELKAHVADKIAVQKNLSQFAQFHGTLEKDDTYFASAAGQKNKIRIRREIFNGTEKKFFVTYKRKEMQKSAEEISTEVNEELETEISDPAPLEKFFADNGFFVALKKHKKVECYKTSVKIPSGEILPATIELCDVPPLGEFAEIEILSDSADEKKISRIQNALFILLEKCGIKKSAVEPKYYSELLAEKNSDGEKNV